MHTIIILAILLIAANIGIFIAVKRKSPNVIALIIVGLIAGLPIFGSVLQNSKSLIFNIGDIGLLSLMFIAGLNSSKKNLHSEEKDSLIVSIFSTLFPFFLALLAFSVLGFPLIIAIVIAVCMSNTAEATNAEVLMDLKKLKTKIGSVIIESGLFDDIFAFFVFILITIIYKADVLKDDVLLIATVAVFFLGLAVQKYRKRKIFTIFEKTLMHIVVPFFFISLGLIFDIDSLILHPLLLVIVLAVALLGKIVGTMMAKPFLRFSYRQLHLIGWAMNSRGAIELALALIAFKANLISIEIYSSLVMMALVTTILFPIVVTNIIKNDPKIMGK